VNSSFTIHYSPFVTRADVGENCGMHDDQDNAMVTAGAAETIEMLNARFRAPGIVFDGGAGGLPRLTINTDQTECEIYLHGAHVTHWRPRGFHPVLWLSERAVFEDGKAIRGGVPVCWPWFGPHPSNPGAKAHGVARTRGWRLIAAAIEADGTATASLALPHSEAICAQWPHDVDAELTIRVGRTLSIALTSHNESDAPVAISEALHTYLAVGDVRAIRIEGYDGAQFLDQTRANAGTTQRGAITFGEETDRIYATASGCDLVDPTMNRCIRVDKSGSGSSVIWNPWPAKTARLGDVAPEAWTGFVCIEAANAGAGAITLPPGARHTLKTGISVEWLDTPGAAA
jgi:glucose-6-phosphate 1-epimerase